MAEGGQGDKDELRIVVIGRTGAGKSSTCNTIVGENKFLSRRSSASVTGQLQSERVNIGGRRVMVVDTPGFFDTDRSPEEQVYHVIQSLLVCTPGPHAFLYVVPVDARYTKEFVDVYTRVKHAFGSAITSYMVLVLTHGDTFDEEFTLDKYETSALAELQLLFSDCCGRRIVFNNRNPTNEVDELIEMIQNLGGGYFQGSIYSQLANEGLDTEIKRRLRESDREELKDNVYVKELQEKLSILEERAKTADQEKKKAEEQQEKYTNEKKKIIKEIEAGRMTRFVSSIVCTALFGGVAIAAAPAAGTVAVAAAVGGIAGQFIGEKLSEPKKGSPKDKDV